MRLDHPPLLHHERQYGAWYRPLASLLFWCYAQLRQCALICVRVCSAAVDDYLSCSPEQREAHLDSIGSCGDDARRCTGLVGLVEAHDKLPIVREQLQQLHKQLEALQRQFPYSSRGKTVLRRSQRAVLLPQRAAPVMLPTLLACSSVRAAVAFDAVLYNIDCSQHRPIPRLI